MKIKTGYYGLLVVAVSPGIALAPPSDSGCIVPVTSCDGVCGQTTVEECDEGWKDAETGGARYSSMVGTELTCKTYTFTIAGPCNYDDPFTVKLTCPSDSSGQCCFREWNDNPTPTFNKMGYVPTGSPTPCITIGLPG